MTQARSQTESVVRGVLATFGVWAGAQAAEPIYIAPDVSMIRLVLADLPEEPRRVHFDLTALGAKHSVRLLATVRGPLADEQLPAVLKVVQLLERAKPIVGPWSIAVAATPQYAHVTLRPLWYCRGNEAAGIEWWLWNDSINWVVRGQEAELRVEFCDPVE